MLSSGILGNFVESFVDNVFRDKVKPVRGSIVYCELAFGTAEHSGVYLSDDRIAHLDGSGKIEIVTAKAFLKRLDGWNTAMSIYVSCRGTRAVGSDEIAKRAINMSGSKRSYSLSFDNCHQFTSGCITGDYENADNFLFMLKSTVAEKLKAKS